MKTEKKLAVALVALGVLVAALILGGWRYWVTAEELKATRGELASTTAALEAKIQELDASLNLTLEEKAELAVRLAEEEERNNAFADQIGEITDSVGTLEKLARLDPELLQKYSKVFFLNEHYTPPGLALIDKEYWFDADKPQEIHAAVWPHLEDLLERAKRDGVDLRVASGYRSFGTQATLKTGYSITYGTGANQFSADQGYSEHQLGTALDFITPDRSGLTTSFAETDAYRWLSANGYRYGFVLSYPENNVYYQFEPWHWRFVGEDLARDLHRAGRFFYDFDQREIDEYLVKIFD